MYTHTFTSFNHILVTTIGSYNKFENLYIIPKQAIVIVITLIHDY